jgi:hypothetical protein
MSEEKKIKKAMKKSAEKKEHKCTCGTDGCCSNNIDTPFVALGTTVPKGVTIKDVLDNALKESKADMNDILTIIKDYCSTSGKTFDDIATAIAEEERRKNEKLFIDMVEKVEEAITSFMQNSTDSDETKNTLLKEMFSKLTSLYLSSALKNKIDEWKKAQKNICLDIKDKLATGKQQEPKVLFKNIEDIFPWMKDESSANTKDDEEDANSEYLKDFDFPFTYKDEERNITINADIIGESNESIDIQIETEYEDKDMCISHVTETSYDRDEKLFKFFEDCMESIHDLYKTKKSCCNFN